MGIQATGKIQNTNAIYKGSDFVSSAELLEIFQLRRRQKLLHIVELSSVKLLSLIKTQLYYKVYTCVDARKEIGVLCSLHCDTCELYPSQKIVQLGRHQDWFVTLIQPLSCLQTNML